MTLPKGAQVLLPQWVVHRDPRWFDDPLAFRPERWLDGLSERLHRFAYFPFGGGPRQCIGNTFAMMEMTFVIATLAQRYRLNVLPGPQVKPAPGITLRSNRPITVRRELVLPTTTPVPVSGPIS